MDLSFSRFDADATIVALPPDLAVMMVGVAARQAASPTAMAQARLPAWRDGAAGVPARPAEADRFAPAHGSFNRAVAVLLATLPKREH